MKSILTQKIPKLPVGHIKILKGILLFLFVDFLLGTTEKSSNPFHILVEWVKHLPRV